VSRENVIAQFRLERIGTDTRGAGGTALRAGLPGTHQKLQRFPGIDCRFSRRGDAHAGRRHANYENEFPDHDSCSCLPDRYGLMIKYLGG
jgi:hypothetical protein